MRTRIVSDIRFTTCGGQAVCRAAVIVKDWDDEPEVVHWSDRNGLHIEEMPQEMYDDLLAELKVRKVLNG